MLEFQKVHCYNCKGNFDIDKETYDKENNIRCMLCAKMIILKSKEGSWNW